MADEIKIPITSTYDSKGGDAALKQAQAIEKAKPTLTIDSDSKAATKDISAVLKMAGQLSKDPATLLLTSNATEIAKQITDLVMDLDKLDAADPQVSIKVDQINALQGDLDKVEGKLKEINNVEVSPTVDVDTTGAQHSMGKIVDGAGQANSAIANMVGNSAQDLGELGGVAGSAGVAVGQLAEYFTDSAFAAKEAGQGFGSIFRSFAGAAVPIAALTVAVSAVGSIFQDIADRAARARDLVKKFADTSGDMEATRDVIQGLSDDLAHFDADARTGFGGFVEGVAKATKSIPVLGGLIGDAGQNVTDVLSVFNQLDISSADVAEAVDQQGASWDALLVNLWAAKEAGQITAAQYEGAVQVLQQYRDAHNEAADATKFHTDIERDAAANAKTLNDAYRDAANGSTAYADSQQRSADMLDRVNGLLTAQASALTAQSDAAIAAADSTIAVEQAQENFTESTQASIDAQATLDEAIAKHGASSKEATEATKARDEALRHERASAIDAANAAVRLAQDQATAAGSSLSATQKLDTFNDTLLANARNATPAAREAIADYIIQANKVPPEKATDIKAAIVAGDFETAKTKLNEASATRTANIQADANTAAAERELNNTARNRTAEVTANVTVRGITAIGNGQFRLPNGIIVGRFGGMAGPEGRIAGEAGPEFIRLPDGTEQLLTATSWVPPGTQITSTAETERILRERERDIVRTGGDSVTNVTVNVPRGYRGDVLADARKAARRSGGLYRRNHR